MKNELTYDDFLQRLNIQTVLQDAGYVLNRRDGLRYPSYVRLDSDGRRIHGDKFIVNAGGWGCFRPPEQKTYNVISLIKEHPELFADYKVGMDKDHLVNLVCNRLLNNPMPERRAKIIEPHRDIKPFRMSDYDVKVLMPNDRESQRAFDKFFGPRGIDHETQAVFKDHFFLATKHKKDGLSFANMSFPLRIPNKDGIVGLEERGAIRKDGKSYKGKAEGSNGSEGLWIVNLSEKPLTWVKNVLWFESAYDALAYYQLHRHNDNHKDAVYVSTGGNPTVMQFRGVIEACPNAVQRLCFDNDLAGKSFVANFNQAYEQYGRNTLSNYLNSLHDASKLGSGNTDLLPPPLSSLYADYEDDAIEYYSSRQSGLVCPQELKDLKEKASDSHDKFMSALHEAVKSGANYVVEYPKGPYKDWNDALLGKADPQLVAQGIEPYDYSKEQRTDSEQEQHYCRR